MPKSILKNNNINQFKTENEKHKSYMDYFWFVKNDEIFKFENGSYICNVDKKILEELQKTSKELKSCTIQQVKSVCI